MCIYYSPRKKKSHHDHDPRQQQQQKFNSNHQTNPTPIVSHMRDKLRFASFLFIFLFKKQNCLPFFNRSFVFLVFKIAKFRNSDNILVYWTNVIINSKIQDGMNYKTLSIFFVFFSWIPWTKISNVFRFMSHRGHVLVPLIQKRIQKLKPDEEKMDLKMEKQFVCFIFWIFWNKIYFRQKLLG